MGKIKMVEIANAVIWFIWAQITSIYLIEKHSPWKLTIALTFSQIERVWSVCESVEVLLETLISLV